MPDLSADVVVARAGLLPWFEEAQRRGFLGPGPIAPHLEHAGRFAQVVPEAPADLLDLGSGGGIPGLVLAACWPATRVVLLDAAEKRTRFLVEVTEDLGWMGRVRVLRGRAEELAHQPGLRHAFGLVTARSFGPPAVVAECATGFLATNGRLVVSEPPDSTGDRWDAPDALAALHLTPDGPPRRGLQVLRQVEPCPDRYPRRVGIPAKRPLF